MSKSTSAEWRSLEIWSPFPGASGERTFRTSAWCETPATTSLTAASNAGVPAVALVLWIRTFSEAGLVKSLCRIRSIRPDSPGPVVFGFGFFTPTMPPMPKATTTRASQPNVAVFQWAGLPRSMRAARLRGLRFGLVLEDTVLLLSVGPRSRGIGERVVEGVECELGRDGELEAVADAVVPDLDGQRVLAWVPEKEDVDSVALPGCELAGVIGAGHLVSSCVDD